MEAAPVEVANCDTEQAAPVEVSNYINSKFKDYFEMVGGKLAKFQVHLHMPPRKI